MDVVGEVVVDGGGREGDAGGPLADEIVDVGEAVVAGLDEVSGELLRCDVGDAEGFGAYGPDGGDPGEIGAGAPLVCEVVPGAGAGLGFDGGAVFDGHESGVADEDGGVGLVEHGDGVGGGGDEGGLGVEELAEEDLRVGEGAAGGGVGGDGLDGAEGVRVFDDELDGADVVKGGDDAAGDDGEVWREGGDGDETEVGAAGEKFVGAEGGLGVVEGVALG